MSVPEPTQQAVVEGLSPVRRLPTDPPGDAPEPGVALCLSGGGYRAMLFHVGALWRLNELGWLPKLDRVSSVSGGSITAGVLALRWSQLAFDGDGCGRRVRDRRGRADPRTRGQDDRRLRRPAGDLPPRLDRRASSQTLRPRAASAGRPSRPCPTDRDSSSTRPTSSRASSGDSRSRTCADYRVGKIPQPEVKLSIAVAASSAFPPFLSPLRLDVEPGRLRRRAPAPTWRRRRISAARCSPTAGSTTTSGSRRPGSAIDGPRQRRRRPYRGEGANPDELGAPGDARARRDRQPGASAPQASDRRRLRPRAPRGRLLGHLEPRRRLRPRRRARGRRRRSDEARPRPPPASRGSKRLTRNG